MADDIKADECFDELRTAFADSIRQAAAGLPAHQVLQLADSLCMVQMDVLAGKRIRYKALPKVDGDAITEAWRRGMTLVEITREFRISRTAAYKYHPNTNVRRARA